MDVVTYDRVQFNTLRPRQNGRHFADDTYKRIFLKENVGISIKISLKFVPKGPINNISALVQVMVWPRPGDKPFTEPMVLKLLRRIYVSLGLDELMLVWFISQKETVGHYSLSGKTFYRQISWWSLEAARLDIMIVPLWNLTSITAALLLMCLSNPSERLEKSQPESGGGGGLRCEGWKIDLCSNFDCVVTCDNFILRIYMIWL